MEPYRITQPVQIGTLALKDRLHIHTETLADSRAIQEDMAVLSREGQP